MKDDGQCAEVGAAARVVFAEHGGWQRVLTTGLK